MSERRFALGMLMILAAAWAGATAATCKEGETPSAEELFQRGVALYKNGHFEDSMEPLRQAAELDPTNKRAMWYLLRAQERVQDELAQKKRQVEAAFKSGLEFYGDGELRKALIAFDETLQLDPLHERAREYLQRVEMELGLEPGSTLKEKPSEEEGYIIGPEDVLLIRSVGSEDLSGQYIVGPEGKIPFPYIGQVQAAGKTRYQLAKDLSEALSVYYTDLQITVEVLEYGSRKVLVLGEVRAPGEYPMKGNVMTVRDAVVQAGLPTVRAAMRRVHVIKPDPAVPDSIRVNLYDILYKGRLDKDVALEPGDVVFVPSTVASKLNEVLSSLLEPATRTMQIEQIRQQIRLDYYKNLYEYYHLQVELRERQTGRLPE